MDNEMLSWVLCSFTSQRLVSCLRQSKEKRELGEKGCDRAVMQHGGCCWCRCTDGSDIRRPTFTCSENAAHHSNITRSWHECLKQSTTKRVYVLWVISLLIFHPHRTWQVWRWFQIIWGGIKCNPSMIVVTVPYLSDYLWERCQFYWS